MSDIKHMDHLRQKRDDRSLCKQASELDIGYGMSDFYAPFPEMRSLRYGTLLLDKENNNSKGFTSQKSHLYYFGKNLAKDLSKS